MSSPIGGFSTFGSYRLDATSRVLTRSGALVALAPKTFDLLVLLVESGGRLLSKRELMDALWRDTAVEEANLSFQVSTLRKALGEEGSAWIEAVPKHGYRFRASVGHFAPAEGQEPKSPPPESAEQVLPESHLNSRRLWRKAALVGGLAIAAALGIWERWFNERKPVIAAALNAFPATTYRGQETNPSFSPDGSQIAFAWDAGDGGDFDIYVKVVGENKALRLTSDRRNEFSPAWSPDGRRIAFCRDGPLGSEIVVLSALGGPERIIASLPQQEDPANPGRPLSWFRGVGYPNAHLAWFPDGLFLAAVARSHPGGPNRIFLLSVDEQVLKPLTSPPHGSWGDDSPAVSPNGRSLAFVRSLTPYPAPSYIHVESVSSQKAEGEPQRLNSQEITVAGLAWTSDGHRLIFRSNGSLWTGGLDQRAPEPLALPGYNPRFPAISAKGDRLAFVDASQDLDIWRIDGPASKEKSAAGSTTVTRLISSTRMDTNPQYSPDGTRIAFTSSRSGNFQIWVCESDGSNPVQLTYSKTAQAGTPRWSPDGRFIAFDSLEPKRGNVADVYVIPAQGGPPRRITAETSNEDMPSWSHDGKWIYFESDRSGVFEIWKVPFEGGSAVRITDGGGASAFESPNGNSVYYTKWSQRGLWRMRVEGGPEERVSEIGSPYLWGMYDKGACVVDVQSAAGPAIQCLDFVTGHIKLLCTLPREHRMNEGGPSFSISRDGRWILFVGIERQESDIMIVDKFR